MRLLIGALCAVVFSTNIHAQATADAAIPPALKKVTPATRPPARDGKQTEIYHTWAVASRLNAVGTTPHG